MEDLPASRVDHIICQVIGGALETVLTRSDVRFDVDLFDGMDDLIAGRPIDSLDVVHITAALEDHFGLETMALVDDLEKITLGDIAEALTNVAADLTWPSASTDRAPGSEGDT